MAQTAAHLVDHVIPNVPVRQWVISLPIPLRYLLAAHPHLLTPVLQVIQRAISTFLIKQAGLKRRDAQTGAITLIQCFGSAANLNIHLHCLVLDGVYRIQNDTLEFRSVRSPTADQLQALLSQIIKRVMKALTRHGHGALIEEEGMTYLADIESNAALAPLQSAVCTYRIALDPRAGQKVLTLKTVATQNLEQSGQEYCANAHSFSLHAGVRCAMNQRNKLERLCRYITRPVIADERLARNKEGQVVLTLKTPYRDGITHIVLSPLEFMQRRPHWFPGQGSTLFVSMACLHQTRSFVLRLFLVARKTKVMHQMRVTLCRIPRLPCVSVGRVCSSGCLRSTLSAARIVAGI